ncbi:hypothetical protein, partial [Corynebacterium macclintockiae]|uniref:hypothetical protein n=1 Tax=Corynebacterium macclintockiae TaxID=2913501 RepID=UPI00254DA4E5
GVTPPLTTTDKPIQNKTHTHNKPQPGFQWCAVPFQTLHNRREQTILRHSKPSQHKNNIVLNIG